MPQDLILFGHGGSYNHGCEAIVRSTLEILGRLPGGAPHTALYSSDPPSDREFGLDSLVELHEQRRPFCIWNPADDLAMVLRKFFHRDQLSLHRFFSGTMDGVRDSLCVSIGGDMYCYGRLPWLYYLHSQLKEQHNRTLLWGCSVDNSSFLPESLEDLRRYDRIVTRESVSLALFAEHGFTNVALYPDPAFALRPREIRPAELPAPPDPARTLALNISPLMRRYQGKSPLTENVRGLIRHVLRDTDLDILLLPHVNGWTEQENDHAFLRSLLESCRSAGEDTARIRLLGRQYSCEELKFIISRCRFLVTARTHASIAAYSTGVPALVLGYSPKARGIARDIFGDEKHYVVPVQRLEGERHLSDAFDWMVHNEAAIRAHLDRVMPDYIARAYAAGQEIAALL